MKAIIISLILAISSTLTAAPAEVVAVQSSTGGVLVTFNQSGDVYDYYFEEPTTLAAGQLVTLIINTQGTKDVMDDTIEMIIAQ